MKNIFKNAHFGKMYKTRDGRKALYWCFDGQKHKLIIADDKAFQPWCGDDGLDYVWNLEKGDSPLDIVSEWQEPINEKELDKLAKELYPDDNPIINLVMKEMQNAYKAGYYEAKRNGKEN